MPDDMSTVATPPAPADQILGGQADPNAPVPFLQPPQDQVTPQQAASQYPYPGEPQQPPQPPAAQPPQQPPQAPQQMPPMDSQTQQHMSGIHRAINAVANLLGGPITYQMTQAPDGSYQISPQPSTQGEKWGRIAANALGGFVAGAANAQGPGGMMKAAAAGTQYGLQQPEKQLKQSEEDVDFQNKQLMSKAQHTLLDQQILAAQFKNQQEPIKFSEEQADYSVKMAKSMDDLGGVFVGNVKTAQDLTKYKSDQDAIDAHTGKSDGVLMPIPKADGSTDIYRIPPDTAKQRTTDDWTYQKPYLDPNDSTKVLYKTFTETAGSSTIGDRAKNQKALLAESDKTISQAATNAKNLASANKQPKTDEWSQTMSAASAAAARGDTAEATRLTNLAHQQLGAAQTLKETGTATGAGIPGIGAQTQIADLIKPGAPFAPGTVDGTIAQKLADGSNVLGDFPRRMAKGAPTPYQYSAAAEAYSQGMYGLPWSETDIQQEKKFFNSDKVQGALDGIDKMIGRDGHPGYLDTVVDLARRANIGGSAPINQGVLWVKTHMGDQAAKDYQTALGEVQRTLPSLIGNPLLGGSDSDLKLRQAKEMFGSNPTMGNLLSTSQTLSNMLRGSVNSYASNNRYLQRRYGLQGPFAKQFGMPGQGAPGAGAGGGAPTPTPGATAGGGGAPNPPSPAALKGQPFDATLYQTQHPGKDVQDAVNRARNSGMNVTNLPQGVR